MTKFKYCLRLGSLLISLKPFMIHALAQVIALIGSIVRIPLILSGLSQLEFSAILICLQFLGMSGLIFGASRLFSRNPPVRFQTSEFTVDVQTMAKEILSISGWLFGLGFLNSQLFLLLFFPRGDYGLFLSVILMLLSTSLFGFSAYFGTLTGILDSRNKYNGVAFSDVASTILMIPLTYWAVNSNANPWIYLAIGSLTLFNMGIYAIVKLRHERIFHRIKFKLSFTDFKGVSGRMGQGLGAFLSNNFDLVIIGKFGNQVDAIEYSATSRINLAIDLPSAANAPKQWSQIAKLTETDAGFPSNLRKINFRFTFGNLVLVSPIAGAIFLLYEPYMQSLFGENYIPNYLLLGTVLVARIIYTTYSTLYLSLSTSSRVHMFTRLGIYIGLLNIALSCFAVKILPLIGAALGTTIASLIGIVVILFVNRRRPSNKKSSP